MNFIVLLKIDNRYSCSINKTVFWFFTKSWMLDQTYFQGWFLCFTEISHFI